MNGKRLLLIASLLLAAGFTSFSQTITWNGHGDQTSWFDPNNWVGSQVPDAANDVVITSGLGTEVIITNDVSIDSIQCNKALTIATANFMVTGGTSLLQGTLTFSSIGAILTASGPGVTLTCTGPTTADEVSFVASGGATLSLPKLTHYTHTMCFIPSWDAGGAGSTLNLSGLTNMDCSPCNWIFIQAFNGGAIIISNLPTMASGDFYVTCDATNSLVDLSTLASLPDAVQPAQISVSNGGEVRAPLLKGGPNLSLSIASDGIMPVAQLQQAASIVVSAETLSFTGITNFDGSGLDIEAGAVVTLPNLHNYQFTCAGGSGTLKANGPGSVLDLSGVTNITLNNCSYLTLQSLGGGTLVLSNVAAFSEGYLYVQSDGAGSLTDLSKITNLPNSGGATSQLLVSDDAEIRMPLLQGGPMLTLSLSTGGILAIAQIHQVTSISVNGMTASFPGVTNFDEGVFDAEGGGVITMPNLRSYSHTNCGGPNWQAQSVGSVLDLTALTNLTLSPCNWLYVQALSGGSILLGNVPAITNGYLDVVAGGAGSLVDLSKITALPSTNGTTQLNALGGEIRMPGITGGPFVTLSITTGGIVDVSHISQLEGVTVNGTTESFPGITNFDESGIDVEAGGLVTMPNLRSYQHINCNSPTWQANGAGSILDLSGITNLVTSTCNWLYLTAGSGGEVLLTNLPAITNGYVNISSAGAGSLVDISKITAFPGTNGQAIINANTSGEVRAPLLTGGPQFYLTLASDGIFSTAQISQLAAISIAAQDVTLPGLTNFDEGSIDVETGGTLAIPNLHSYEHTDCSSPILQANGAGAVLDLSSLTNITLSSCNWLYLQANVGGDLILSNITSFADGYISILSENAGSVIDLSQLSGLVLGPNQGQLSETAGGVVLLNNSAFLIANVAITVDPGNPVLPSTLISSGQLSLYGQDWHSYLVEERDTTIPGSPWVVTARIAMTNSIQEVAPLPPPNTAFRVTELLADPAVLDISLQTGGTQEQMVIFGLPGQSYQIQTSADPSGGWSGGSIVNMTNSFHFFAPVTPVGPAGFFRAKKL